VSVYLYRADLSETMADNLEVKTGSTRQFCPAIYHSSLPSVPWLIAGSSHSRTSRCTPPPAHPPALSLFYVICVAGKKRICPELIYIHLIVLGPLQRLRSTSCKSSNFKVAVLVRDCTQFKNKSTILISSCGLL
jgi:hypothetical protein